MAGLRFNTGKIKWRYLTPQALGPMIEVLEYGDFKYSLYQSSKDSTKKFYGHQIHNMTYKTIEGSEWVKIEPNKWGNGLSITECSESLMRHLFSFLEGNDIDKESGCLHIGHILCNALFISYMFLFKPETDDRHLTKRK